MLYLPDFFNNILKLFTQVTFTDFNFEMTEVGNSLGPGSSATAFEYGDNLDFKVKIDFPEVLTADTFDLDLEIFTLEQSQGIHHSISFLYILTILILMLCCKMILNRVYSFSYFFRHWWIHSLLNSSRVEGS